MVLFGSVADRTGLESGMWSVMAEWRTVAVTGGSNRRISRSASCIKVSIVVRANQKAVRRRKAHANGVKVRKRVQLATVEFVPPLRKRLAPCLAQLVPQLGLDLVLLSERKQSPSRRRRGRLVSRKQESLCVCARVTNKVSLVSRWSAEM